MEEGGPAFPIGPRSHGEGTNPGHPTFPQLPRLENGVDIRIVSTTPGAREDLRSAFLRLMDRARRELLISTPYFSSDEALDAILAAARRGVRVVLVLPDEHNDSVDFRYAARLHYEVLLDAGVEVYEYQRRMTHAKVFISDDTTVIGSANLNRTSVENHYEVAAIIPDARFTSDFRARLFDGDLPRSHRVRKRDLPALIDLNPLGEWWSRNVVQRFF